MTEQTTEYTVVYGVTFEGLIEAVNEHIADGWRPQGGFSVTAVTLDGQFETRLDRYFQAMVRDK